MGRKRLAMTLRDGEKSVTVTYPERDLGILGEPLLPEGEQFVIAAGVYANYSVARGQNTEAWSRRPRVDLLLATTALSRAVERDLVLLSRDYSYKMPWSKSWSRGGESGFTVKNLFGSVHARRPGQVYLTLMELGPDGRGVEVETVDLRPTPNFPLDSGGAIRLKSTEHEVEWPRNLPTLLGFLRSSTSEFVDARHHFA